MSPGVSGMVIFSSDIWVAGRAAGSNVWFGVLSAEAYSVSEAVEEAQWLRSVLAEMWPSVPSSSLCDSIYTGRSMIMQRAISRHFTIMNSGQLSGPL